MSDIVKSRITKVDLRLNEVFGTEDLIAEEGELTLYVKNEAVAEEKYIVLWKKERKFYFYIFKKYIVFAMKN